MKRLLLFFLFSGSLSAFSQDKPEKLYLWPDGKWSVLDPGPPLKATPDTLRATLIVYYDRGPAILHTKPGFVVRGEREIYLDDRKRVIKSPLEVLTYKIKKNN